MPTWLKIVLGILIGSVVICGGVVGACALFVKGKAESAKSALADAEKYGKSHTDQQVLEEALTRSKKCGQSDAMCEISVGMFYGMALNLSQSTPEFCEGVPQSGNVTATNAWEQQKCKSLGYENDRHCTEMVRQVPIHCYQKAGGKVGNAPGNDKDEGKDDGKDEPEPEDDQNEAPPTK